MGNCLSTCTARSQGQNGGEVVISYSGGKIYQTPKDASPQIEKDSKEFSIVQKELEALQTQISHSQAVLASLKFTFLEAPAVRSNTLDKVHRTTQTFQDAGLPKSLEDVPSTVRHKEMPEHARSCPAIANIGVQTDVESSRLQQQNYQQSPYEQEYFLPPIESSLEMRKEQVPISVQTGLDLDIYRSCRKLSVLPEEEVDETPPTKLVPTRFPDQAHSFDSYLLPATSPAVVRQMSDPTPSVRRPLQVATLHEIGSALKADTQTEAQTNSSCSTKRVLTSSGVLSDEESQVPSGVEDSGLGSELRLASSPSPSTPCFKTPPGSPISDQSLSWQTPTSDSESPEPPEKQLLSVLIDPGGCLAPAEPLVRVPSRRRLVRSFARIGSETAEPTDSYSDSTQLPDNMNETKDDKEESMETNQQVFPNLTDDDLKRLGLWVEPTDDKDPQMEDENVQNKYTSLVLAFKTDKMTLARRLELQNKLRDQAELNMTHEVETLKSAIQLLSTLGADFERNDLFEKIRIQIDALYKSALRVSSTAEMYGAVQQENRLSKAVDIILKYVENLKHTYDKEKTEHEETRRLLRESKIPVATPAEERRGSASSRRGSQFRRATISKNDSQNDMLRTNGVEGDQFNKIYEDCETCGSPLRQELDSNQSQPNSSDESSNDETRVFKRTASLKEENINRKVAVRQKFRKRTSFSTPIWVQRISRSMQWLQPYEDFALQFRYFIASVLVLAAILIVAASFFQSSGK